MGEFTHEKDFATIKANYEMYEKTIKETKSKMKTVLNPDGTRKYSDKDIKKRIETLENAQNAIVIQYAKDGGNPEDLVKKKTKKAKETAHTENEAYLDLLNEVNASREMEEKKLTDNIQATAEAVERTIPEKCDYNPHAAFDVIPLPSKGEGYKNKKASIPVAYLTAYDEDMIVSPNLYRDNQVLDYIIRAKVMNNEIDPSDLLEGDREAIVLFLRASGYGPEYPITATDDRTGTQFDSVVDLSKLKYKEFNLKGDANGWFEYTLPVSKAVVKFRFPTHKDMVTLKKLDELEEFNLRKERLADMVSSMDMYIDKENSLDGNRKIAVRQAINEIRKWEETLQEGEGIHFSHPVTNKFNLLIMSVNDVTDRKYIMDVVRSMNVRDSSALRKYMTDNEPGIDFNLEVERPQSLGGGSMKVFLQLDQFVFLNIAN